MTSALVGSLSLVARSSAKCSFSSLPRRPRKATTKACRSSKHPLGATKAGSESMRKDVVFHDKIGLNILPESRLSFSIETIRASLAAILTFSFPQCAFAASESSVDETTTGFAAFAVLLGSLYVFKARQVSAKRAPPPKPKINDGKRWFQRNRKLAKKVTYTPKEERKAGIVIKPRTAGVEGKTRYKSKISIKAAAQKWSVRANPTTKKREGAPNFFTAPTELLKYKRGEAVVQGKGKGDGRKATATKPKPAATLTSPPLEETAATTGENAE